jgi:hypothetical protein
MAVTKEVVGFIFECGRDGPDYKVCRHLLGQLNANIEMVTRFLDHKQRLLSECGPVAAELLTICSRIVVIWDLMPPWGTEQPCRYEDKRKAFQSLKEAKVPRQKVTLICIEQERECWLIADVRALGAVLLNLKHPHQLGNKLKDYKAPDRQITHPKTELISLFQRELGKTRKYRDHNHALLLAQAIPNWSKLRRSDSFRRFAEKAAKAEV